MGKRIPLLERWERQVVMGDTDACWEWTGHLTHGYGYLAVWDGDRWRESGAHRVAYELFVGPIDDGLQIDHACHHRSCVNPAHLRLATPGQNMENRAGPTRAGSSGFRGVSLHSSGLWLAYASKDRRRYRAGYFRTPEEANEAAIALRNRLFTHNDADRAA